MQQTEEKTESDTDNDGIIDLIEIKYSYKYNGFEVVNNEGKVIQKIEYPEGHEYGDDFEIWQTGDKCYLLANTQDSGDYSYEYEYTYYIYEIIPESSSLKKVNVVRSNMRVNPSATKAGNIINIELGEDSAYSDIRIIDMSGRAVASMAAEGRSVVPFNTALLSAGVYVVMASDGKASKETAKIIIR